MVCAVWIEEMEGEALLEDLKSESFDADNGRPAFNENNEAH